jgi:ABC-type multidrug transport system fused ATPase/permease subunit
LSFGTEGFSESIKASTIFKAYKILESKDRKKLRYVVALQIMMGILDLVGVALFGVLGSLAINGVGSKAPGNRVQEVLKILHIETFSLQSQASILGILAVSVLVVRTLVSVMFIRRTLIFLSRRAAALTESLTSKLLAQDLQFIQRRSTQETVYSLTTGVGTVILSVLGTAVSIISDSALLIILSIGLFLVDPLVALSSYLLFGFVAFVLYRLMHQRARKLGEKFADLSILSSEKILEILATYRESAVRNRRRYYSNEIARIRYEVADTTAEIQFQPNISKYVLETTVIVGTLLLAAAQFSFQDSSKAAGTLAVFMAAATRIAPAVLRLQQGAIQIKGCIGSAQQTLNLISELENSQALPPTSDEIKFSHENFSASIDMSQVNFKYSESQSFEVRNIDLHANPGEVIAVVGKSGSGKTTIIDLLLGVLSPKSGKIRISGVQPMEAISNWPGAIAYVPQNVAIISGTIRQNVILGFKENPEDDIQIWNSLRTAQLEEFVLQLPERLDTLVGEFGTRLSGGQRQRLGIARALFTNPKLLILDEATSSLDGLTESELSKEINSLKGSMTIVLIAHRISTISAADRIYYIENGNVLSHGNFEALSAKISEFGDQAERERK